MSARRLPEQPGELIRRGREIGFTFDGTERRGLEGDTIASALAADGQRVLSRSFKYHRPRGLFCCSGQCPNCLVDVDGAPGVRACTEPLREGMEVRHLNAWPSLEFDAMRAVDRVGRPFTPPGFYYKTFMRPRRLWPLYERGIRRVAGLGRLPAEPSERQTRADHRTRHADVLVVGGGRAGLEAAADAAAAGADVVLADDGPVLGGRMLWSGFQAEAAALARHVAELGVEVLSPGSALGWFHGLVPIWQDDVIHRVRAASLVVATGTIPQPLPFRGNDLPGVLLCDGALRLATLYAVAPGTRAVVCTIDDEGIDAAISLAEAGVEVAAIVDSRPAPAGAERLSSGVELIAGSTVLEAHGRAEVRAVSVASVEAGGIPGPTARRIECDLVAVSGGRAPAASLLMQAGARVAYHDATGAFVAADLPPGVRAVGSVRGIEAGERGPVPSVRGDRSGGRCFVCLCEDVTEKDVNAAVAEGFDSIELAKRYLTATMGPCQGRMCQLPSARSIARETGTDPSEIGVTTARPPIAAVPLGLIAGRQHEPGSRSALDAQHRELGGAMDWAGIWRRAYDYGDPGAEALHVHREAGLIDVSPLGKFLVQGPDAAEFLDRVYPNRLSTLDEMRIRYGVLVTEAGRIMDDGTVCRLDHETFYVTTTTGGSAAVLQWLRWWLAEWGMEVRITDLTGTLGAMNLAGPRSRDALAPLTEIDVGGEAFPYLHARTGRVAGVECLVLRLGFVGELGYEIHMPSVHARRLWSTILGTPGPVDVRPAGLEAQRILRLEKQHLIPSQDTDSESTPYGASLPWIVKLDKEQDFLGRWSLEMESDHPGTEKLVGFTAPRDQAAEEGAAVVVDGAPAGRVTSCRVSEVLDRTVGLAWVPPELAQDGAEFGIASNGSILPATVTTEPFYDPEGERQRA
ncbi:MAG TPA: 2Fe-2S iron-sulfur cluster-binding protein [Solirubrobacterales bacterium]|nr:2Fe-2S iron-sulfur cluster-binding protein [Solirubrobacterales bacterium]